MGLEQGRLGVPAAWRVPAALTRHPTQAHSALRWPVKEAQEAAPQNQSGNTQLGR